MRTSDRADLLFLYAAGALEGAEREEIDEWIASGAPEAAEQLARAEDEVALLAAAQPRESSLPSGVRDRLRSRIASAERAQARARWLARPALAASLAGLLAAGFAGLSAHELATRQGAEQQAALQSELEGLRAERDELDADLGDTEARLRSLESDLVLAAKTVGVLQAEHAESLAIAGTEHAPDARGRVFWDWDAWYCYARITGLAKGSDPIYAMWLFTEDGAIGVGTFRADAQGNATFLSPVPHDVGHVVRAGVSLEPDEDLGSKPRGTVVMLGEARS